MPHHVAFLLRHALIGTLVALAFTGMVLWFDIGHIRHLVLATEEGPLALAVFTVFMAITFASVQMGIRIMGLGEEEDDNPGNGPSGHRHEAVPIRVERER